MNAWAPLTATDDPVAGRYRFEAEIACVDAMRLARALDTETGRYVALALLPDAPGLAERAWFAAAAGSTLDHPHVARLLDTGEEPRGRYAAYDYVPGRTLAEVIRRDAPLPIADALQIVLEVTSGLRALHAAGLIHGRLCPDHVVLGWDGEVRLTGYGVSGSAPRPPYADEGDEYRAPEQVAGLPPTRASDLYAVGVLLADLAIGAGRRAAVMPESVRAILHRARAEDPSDRFPSALALESAIVGAMSALPAPPPLEPPAALVLSSAPIPAPASVPVSAAVRHRSGPLVPAGLALAAVLALVLIVGYIITAAMAAEPARGVVAGVSEDGQPAADAVDVTLGDEPEVVDEPGSVSERERDLMAAKARLARTAESGAPPERPAQPVEEVAPAVDAAPAPAETAAPAAPPAETVAPARPTAVRKPKQVLAFEVTDWDGGWTREDPGFLGRPWVSLYGANSGYGKASITFTLDELPQEGATLRLVGVDDQSGKESRIRITVNGQRVFSGASPFPSWDGSSDTAPWTAKSFTVPVSALRTGENVIVIANLNPSDNFGRPPFVLISNASLTVE